MSAEGTAESTTLRFLRLRDVIGDPDRGIPGRERGAAVEIYQQTNKD